MAIETDALDGRVDTRRPLQDLGLAVAVLIGAVLRLWDLGRMQPIVDETYTLVALRMPVGEMMRHLDATDPHPPLAYLVLRAGALFSDDVGTLRGVSAIAGALAVGVMALWLRRSGLLGLVATALFAIAPFQLVYAREVRMYGILCLAGVTTAWCTDRWLGQGGRRWALGAVGAATVVAFSHATGLLLLVALLAVPLRRTDRSANELRGLTIAGMAAFGLLWGSHALAWSGNSGGFPDASPGWAGLVLNELVAPAPEQRWLVLPVLLGGIAALIWRGGPLTRVWVCLAALPFVVLYVASLRRGVLVPRSLMPYSWGVPVALGALAAWVVDRSRILAGALVLILVLAIVPLVAPALVQDDGSAARMASVFSEAGPEDGFAYLAAAWPPDAQIRYYAPVNGRSDLAPGATPWTGVTVLSAAAAAPDRVWFIAIDGDGIPPEASRCGDPRELGDGLSVICLEMPEGS